LIKLLIADDHSFFVQGVMLSLSETDISVIMNLSSADKIVECYMRLNPDVVICDIMFGQEKNGLEILQELLVVAPDAKVILLSQYDQDKMIRQSYKIGAKAFLSKSVERDELIKAIRTVAKGDLYFTQENAVRIAKMTFDRATSDVPLEDILTQKEIGVLTLLSDGFPEKDVAIRLNVSVKTVANIKAAIKEKLKIEKNSSLTKLAIKHGLINIDEF
jgi:two-component system, NarL family, invasion response regulator UvrY